MVNESEMKQEMSERLTSRTFVRNLLRKHDIKVRKRYGQNFLMDENILHKIVDAAELNETAQVLEIGPGLGTLTRELAGKASHVVAVEVDRALQPLLNETIGSLLNVKIIFEDALRMNLNDVFLPGKPRYVVANLPYYITTPLLRNLLDLDPQAKRMVFLVQREVGERLLALPGSSAYGALSVFAQALAEIELVSIVPRQVFYPIPEVESAIVAITPIPSEEQGIVSRVSFELTNRALFGQRRKTLANALKGSPHWRLAPEEIDAAMAECCLDPAIRGERLGVEQIIKLSNSISKRLPLS